MTFRETIKEMLHCDLGFDFYTYEKARKKSAQIMAKGSGILCGLEFVPMILEVAETEFFLAPPSNKTVYRGTEVYPYRQDGGQLEPGYVIADVRGNAELLLKAERTICNIISRLSGIATATSQFVASVKGTSVVLLDTRKDLSLIRSMNKYAVRVGGGGNHRAGMYDGILVKDNDIAAYDGMTQALDVRLRKAGHLTRVEVEVNGLELLQEVLTDGRADAILLDNMSPSLLKQAVAMIRGSKKPYLIEASGVGEFDLTEIAETGVGFISLSSLVSRGEGNPIDVSMKMVS